METHGNGARQPRSRRNRPCDLCRSRKVACKIAVAPPCEFCVTKRHACTFDQAPGPRKRHKPNCEIGDSSESNDASISVVSLSAAVGMAPGAIPPPSLSGSTSSPGSSIIRVDVELGDDFDPLPTAHDQQQLLLQAGSLGPPAEIHATAAIPSNTSPAVNPLVLSPSATRRVAEPVAKQPLSFPSPESQHESFAGIPTRYVGPSGDFDPFLLAHRSYDAHHASVSQYTKATYHRMRALEDSPGLLPPAIFTTVQGVTEQTSADKDARLQFEKLVDNITASGLIALFLRFVHPYLPIISRQQLPTDEDGILDMPLHLLCAICATAIPFVLYDDALCVEAARIPPQEDLFDLASRVLVDHICTPSLPVVQTYLLLVLRHHNTEVQSKDPLIWSQCCQLVSAAQVLGLNEDSSSWRVLPGWERRLRKRLWWAVWATEKWVAFGQGMPSHLHHRDMTLRPLVRADLADQEPRDPEVSLYFLSFVELTCILDDIVESYFTISGTIQTVENLQESLQAAKTYRQRLKVWHQSLPETLRKVLQKGKPGAEDFSGPINDLDGNASLGIAFFTTQLAIFRALIRPISMSHLHTTSTYGGSPSTPSASSLTKQFVAATLTGAMSGLRNLIGFVDRLTTAEWDAFWPGWSRHNFALASTLLMHCYLITSSSNQYIGETKFTMSRLVGSPPGELGDVSSPENEVLFSSGGGSFGSSASLHAEIRLLAQKWRWLLRLAARGAAGKKSLIDISLLRFDAVFTEWNQAQINHQQAR